jgi:hypothetical protein
MTLELTVQLERFEYLLRPVFVFMFPGIFISAIVSGNIHIFSTWVAAVANFAIYFGLTYLAFAVWQKTKM